MSSPKIMNISPKGERFKGFDGFKSVFVPEKFQKVKNANSQGEAFGERFKSHKYMKNNIYIKNNNNLSPIHPTHAHARCDARARV